jgi:meso-butanediol dehydrogenase/(S,S)-butanediol dehydrogenase/diacetyl reductase
MPRFEDKTVVVTGAAGGIGKGIAARFAAEGARVVLADLGGAVHAAAQEVGGLGVRADVTRPGDVEALFAAAGRVDVLVNNAGIITISRLEELTLEDWERVLRVNTTGTFLCCQAAAARMRAQGGGGRILNAASGQARQGFIYTPHYAASKFGVVGLTQSLAKELAADRITVNAYCPGIVGSDMWSYNDREWGRLLGDYAPGELMEEWIAGIPLGRAGTNDDIAALLLFLASDEAAYITGQAINVDGGMFMS